MVKNKKAKTRKLWLSIHIYFGLTIGLVFVMLGITGSLLVFYIDIDELLNPVLVITKSDRPLLSYEEIFQTLKSTHPERKSAWRLEIPTDPERMLTARYYKPNETEHLAFAPIMVSVNPYNSEVVASRFWGDFVMTWIYNLHFRLLLDTTGEILMLIIRCLLLISLFSGLYLWWPSKHKIKQAFSLKKRASKQRFVYDLHKLNGIYGLLILVIIVGTGTLLSLPPRKEIINSVSPLYKPANTQSNYTEDAERITLDAAGSYRINLRQEEEPSPRFPKTNV